MWECWLLDPVGSKLQVASGKEKIHGWLGGVLHLGGGKGGEQELQGFDAKALLAAGVKKEETRYCCVLEEKGKALLGFDAKAQLAARVKREGRRCCCVLEDEEEGAAVC
jgi:hypothetical protein